MRSAASRTQMISRKDDSPSPVGSSPLTLIAKEIRLLLSSLWPVSMRLVDVALAGVHGDFR